MKSGRGARSPWRTPHPVGWIRSSGDYKLWLLKSTLDDFTRNGRLSNGGGEAGAVPTENNEMEQQETIFHHPRISLPNLPQNMSLILKINFSKKVKP